MPTPDSLISTTILLDPPLDRSPGELLAPKGRLSVELEGGVRAHLDPADPRSAGFARLLDDLRRQGRPVYLELDPATSAITKLLVPTLARVVAVRSLEPGVLDVGLFPSHARHTLPLDRPGADELAARLREALADGRTLLVVEDDPGGIIDLREFTPPDDWPMPPFPVPKPWPIDLPWPFRPAWEWLRRLWWWPWWPWWWFGCTSEWTAQATFDAMAARSCDPLTVPPPCIPFRYPDNGCWARAHEMCRLMVAMGHEPKKVWIQQGGPNLLHAVTRNRPECFVEWFWHVAPTLCVRGPGFFQRRRMVIDPSLTTTPVTEADWKALMGDPQATLTDTDWTQYYLSGGTDPGYVLTNADLTTYRDKLQARAIQSGPPPYANCA